MGFAGNWNSRTSEASILGRGKGFAERAMTYQKTAIMGPVDSEVVNWGEPARELSEVRTKVITCSRYCSRPFYISGHWVYQGSEEAKQTKRVPSVWSFASLAHRAGINSLRQSAIQNRQPSLRSIKLNRKITAEPGLFTRVDR